MFRPSYFYCLSLFFFLMISNQEGQSEKKQFFFSMGSQDQFVDFMLMRQISEKRGGVFIDVSPLGPVISNNTFYFELYHNFKGWIFEANYAHLRKNPMFLAPNTLQIPFKKILKDCPDHVDYLSLNLGVKNARLLQILPQRLKFKVITLTCDLEDCTPYFLEKERLFLEKRGYTCVGKKIKNVLNTSVDHWWVHPDYFNQLDLKRLTDLSLDELDHFEVMRKIRQEFQDRFGCDHWS